MTSPPSNPSTTIYYECSPDSPGATKTRLSVGYEDFVEPPAREKGKPKPELPYLIIGFDTEYVAPEALSRSEVKEGGGKYRVLSYQFHCRQNSGERWSGVGCPDDGERISLIEFLVFALGAGVRDGRASSLPTTIYLVGHFLRADLPAFSDFKDFQWALSNVRKTFVSSEAPIPCDLSFAEGQTVKLKIYVRDTMLLTPGGSKGLAPLGDMIGIPKLSLHPDKREDQRLKENMDIVRRQSWSQYREYALNDASICVEFLQHVIDQCQALGIKKIPVTLSSIGVDLLLKSWSQNDADSLEILGREEVVEEKWNSNLNRYQKIEREVPLEECAWYTEFVTETYHGGRNEQFWFGPCYEADWTDYDLSSAYPTAMSLIGFPQWQRIRHSTSVDDFQPTTLGFACVDFKFPETVRYPILPIRTPNGLIFPLEGRSYCAAPEVAVAKQLGAEISIRHGVIVPTDDGALVFGDFIRDCLKKRSQHPKGSVDNLFWKEISNSTYGKTAQGLREKRVFDLRDQETKLLPQSPITNPFFASYITSFVRAVLGEIINSLPPTVMVFSCTTDGFITDASEAHIRAAEGGSLSALFSNARKHLTGKPLVLEKKHQIRLPLGWRTRGQATIKAGQEHSDDPTYNVILAKAGISVPKAYESVQDQSDYMCNLFFQRSEGDTVITTSLIGLRDMIEFDADLVPTEQTKRLSMEFDWKRKPYAIGTSHDHRDHVLFSTIPWKHVDDFIKVREVWTEYQKKSPLCIKSIEDYELFAAYAESMLSLSAKSRRYLSTENTDLVRLRQTLCAAWHHKEWGIDGWPMLRIDNRRVDTGTAAGFAKFLSACDIPTKQYDVENAKGKELAFNACPPTKRCRDAVEQLRKFYPKLDVRELFAVTSEIGRLFAKAANECEFVSRAANVPS